MRYLIDYFVTYKSGGVVIPGSFSVAKGLQKGVGLDNLVLQRDLGGVLLLALPGPDHREVGDHLLGVLGLAGTRLPAVKRNG